MRFWRAIQSRWQQHLRYQLWMRVAKAVAARPATAAYVCWQFDDIAPSILMNWQQVSDEKQAFHARFQQAEPFHVAYWPMTVEGQQARVAACQAMAVRR